jgi:hypothetical protein
VELQQFTGKFTMTAKHGRDQGTVPIRTTIKKKSDDLPMAFVGSGHQQGLIGCGIDMIDIAPSVQPGTKARHVPAPHELCWSIIHRRVLR